MRRSREKGESDATPRWVSKHPCVVETEVEIRDGSEEWMREGAESMINHNITADNILVPTPNMGMSELEMWSNGETRNLQPNISSLHSTEKKTGFFDKEARRQGQAYGKQWVSIYSVIPDF